MIFGILLELNRMKTPDGKPWGVSADDVDQNFIGVSITLHQACIVGWAFSGRASSRLCPICRSDTWRKYSRRKFEVFLTHCPQR